MGLGTNGETSTTGSAGPPAPRISWEGVVRQEWAPTSAIAEFLEAHSRLTKPRDWALFFAGAALATAPALATSPPPWLIALLGLEALVALVSEITWLTRDRLRRARAAVNTNKIVRIEDYAEAKPPPTVREGPPPQESEQLVQPAEGPQYQVQRPSTEAPPRTQ